MGGNLKKHRQGQIQGQSFRQPQDATPAAQVLTVSNILERVILLIAWSSTCSNDRGACCWKASSLRLLWELTNPKHSSQRA